MLTNQLSKITKPSLLNCFMPPINAYHSIGWSVEKIYQDKFCEEQMDPVDMKQKIIEKENAKSRLFF